MALTVFSKVGGSGGGERGELELLFFRLQQTAGFLKSDPGLQPELQWRKRQTLG